MANNKFLVSATTDVNQINEAFEIDGKVYAEEGLLTMTSVQVDKKTVETIGLLKTRTVHVKNAVTAAVLLAQANRISELEQLLGIDEDDEEIDDESGFSEEGASPCEGCPDWETCPDAE